MYPFALSVFYDVGVRATPRVSLARRLEHAISPTAKEFVVYWDHGYLQFAFIDGPIRSMAYEARVAM